MLTVIVFEMVCDSSVAACSIPARNAAGAAMAAASNSRLKAMPPAETTSEEAAALALPGCVAVSGAIDPMARAPASIKVRLGNGSSRRRRRAGDSVLNRFVPTRISIVCVKKARKGYWSGLNKRTLSAATLGSPRAAALLHPGRADMDDGKPEQGERQRLVGQCKPDRNDREQGRDTQRDLDEGDGGQDNGAAGERRARRGTQSGDRLNKGEDNDAIADHPMIELRCRRIAEDGRERARAERFARHEARSHQGPGVVDEHGAQARDQRAKSELAEDQRREDPCRNREAARGARRARLLAKSHRCVDQRPEGRRRDQEVQREA